MNKTKRALITGGAHRIGAVCAHHLHTQGYQIVAHYHRSSDEALTLLEQLNAQRPESAFGFKADLAQLSEIRSLADFVKECFGGLNVLVNNASRFQREPFTATTEASWDAFMDSNLKAPYFLTQALLAELQASRGCVVNIVDIHSERGLPDYPVYSISKAGLEAMTRVLARELAPDVRVNGVSPGAILWPEHEQSFDEQQAILARIALGRIGQAEDIAKAVAFLCDSADYVTGQILKIDGGRTLFC